MPAAYIHETVLTAEQLRAARAMLRLEQAQLADAAGVSVETIRRLERLEGRLSAHGETLFRIVSVLKRAGVAFALDAEGSSSVAYRPDLNRSRRDLVIERTASHTWAALKRAEASDPRFYERPREEVAKVIIDALSDGLRYGLPGPAELGLEPDNPSTLRKG